jgi:predicted patatin/cPLA2 family phospholipase
MAGLSASHMGHPVVEALLRRRDEESQPGSRHDDAQIALVIEGGGMRGIFTAGMATALEQLGLLTCFDAIYGTSAGALTGAFAISGQVAYGCKVYYDDLGKTPFIDITRAVRGGPVMDLHYLVEEVYVTAKPLEYQRVIDDPRRLHCIATNVRTGAREVLSQFSDVRDVQDALLASTRVPWIAGPPVVVNGKAMVDGTWIEAIPLGAAEDDGASHVLCLLSRPDGGEFKTPHSPLSRVVVERYARSIAPALVDTHRQRPERYNRIVAAITQHSENPARVPFVLGIRPPAGTPVVKHLETRTRKLFPAAVAGMQAVYQVFTGESPPVHEALRAFPQLVAVSLS